MEYSSVFLCLTLVTSVTLVHGDDYKPSKNLLTFLNLLSGHYTNQNQVKFESQDDLVEVHENYTGIFRPVVVNGLRDKITFYFETTINGNLFRRGLWVISEENFNVIRLQPLKILSFNSYKPCSTEHDDEVDYSKIRFQPENRPQCLSVFYPVGANTFIGAVPDCLGEKNGTYEKYGASLTCHDFSFFSCLKGFVDKPRLPLILSKDKSYVLPRQITQGARYSSPCRD